MDGRRRVDGASGRGGVVPGEASARRCRSPRPNRTAAGRACPQPGYAWSTFPPVAGGDRYSGTVMVMSPRGRSRWPDERRSPAAPRRGAPLTLGGRRTRPSSIRIQAMQPGRAAHAGRRGRVTPLEGRREGSGRGWPEGCSAGRGCWRVVCTCAPTTHWRLSRTGAAGSSSSRAAGCRPDNHSLPATLSARTSTA